MHDIIYMGFCQKWSAKLSYVQKWLTILDISKVVGTVKSEYGQACTSGTRYRCLTLAARLSIEISFTCQAGTQRGPYYT